MVFWVVVKGGLLGVDRLRGRCADLEVWVELANLSSVLCTANAVELLDNHVTQHRAVEEPAAI